MDAETVGAIAAVAAAIIAIGAAIAAKRSADRSARAEESSARAAERSAKAAEDAVTIDRERLEHERRDRAERDLPVLDAGAKHGGVWLHNGRVLMGVIENVGSTTAIVEGIELEAGGRRQDGTWDLALGVCSPGSSIPVEFVWDGREAGSPIVVHVRFRGSRSDHGATAWFRLRRAGGSQEGHPLYRAAEARVIAS